MVSASVSDLLLQRSYSLNLWISHVSTVGKRHGHAVLAPNRLLAKNNFQKGRAKLPLCRDNRQVAVHRFAESLLAAVIAIISLGGSNDRSGVLTVADWGLRVA